MIRISIFKGGRPGEITPVEVKETTPADALFELVSRLFWSTRIDDHDGERLIIECPDAKPKEFVLFEQLESDTKDGFLCLLQVADWYAEATLLCNEPVFETIKGEIELNKSRPLTPIPA